MIQNLNFDVKLLKLVMSSKYSNKIRNRIGSLEEEISENITDSDMYIENFLFILVDSSSNSWKISFGSRILVLMEIFPSVFS